MDSSPRNAEPSPGTWLALNAVLSGGPLGVAAPEEVARAAVLGEVEALALQLAPELKPWLAAAVERRAHQAMLISFAEGRALEVLEAAGINRWAALKGSAAARLLYDDPALRPRRDVDLLIDGCDMDALMRAAHRAGWSDITHATHLALAGDGPYEREFLLDIGGARVGCDVHRRLLQWRELDVDVTGVLDRAQAGGDGWRTCSAEDLLLHTALHAANAAFVVPLRTWVDVQRLAALDSLDWAAVVDRARTWGGRRCLWVTLRVAARWLKASVPPEVLEALVPDSRVVRRLERDYSGPCPWVMTHPALGPLGRVRMRVGIRDAPGAAMRYLWQTLSREFVLRLRGYRPPSTGPRDLD